MKVYRFVKRTTINKENRTIIVQSNEYKNLEDFEVISPSFPFLRRVPNFAMNFNNTFGQVTQMCKYFFPSIIDLLNFISEQADSLETTKDALEYIIMEIEIPNEVLKEYIGLGFYSKSTSRVEFRLPYKLLYESTSIESLDYFEELIDFYNKKLYAVYLNYSKSYQKFLDYPRKEEYHYDNRLEIYPLFCFRAGINVTKLSLNANTVTDYKKLVTAAKAIASFYREKEDYESRICTLVGKNNNQSFYNSDYERKQLFTFIIPIIEAENIEMKRLLKKTN